MSNSLLEITQTFGVMTVEILQPNATVIDVQTSNSPLIEISNIGIQGPKGEDAEINIIDLGTFN